MDLHLPDDASREDALKSYFRNLIELGYDDEEIAAQSGCDITSIRRKFKGWGWVKRWVELDASAVARLRARANETPRRASRARAAPTAAPPKPALPAASPPTNGGPTSRDFLEPDVRAKLEALKKKKKP
jgi:hypothetical protein